MFRLVPDDPGIHQSSIVAGQAHEELPPVVVGIVVGQVEIGRRGIGCVIVVGHGPFRGVQDQAHRLDALILLILDGAAGEPAV
jgi:hypothetical protein